MENLKITEGMVLFGKGMTYELENCEMEYDINILNGFDEEKSAFLYWMNENDYFEKCYSSKDWFKLEYRTAYYNISMVFVVPWKR